MATLREYFTKDFDRLLNSSQEHKATIAATGIEISYPVRVHFDFDGCAKFVSIYVPEGIDPAHLIRFYLNDISQALKVANGVEIHAGFGDLDQYCSSKDLLFTGRMFVYVEGKIGEDEQSQLVDLATSKEIKLAIRGQKYMDARNKYERPEAFISHDSRDKKDVAERIALGLQKLMCPVWYDEYSLKVGDSLRLSIEKGIKEARKCIVTLIAS